MPELDPVRQDITADVDAYLAAMDEMIARAEAFARAANEAQDAVAKFGIAADDAAELVAELSRQVDDVADAFAKMVEPAGAATSSLKDLRTASATAATAEGVLGRATVGLDDVLDDLMISAGAAQREVTQLREALDQAGTAASTVATAGLTDFDGKLDDLVMLSTVAVSELHDLRDALIGVAAASKVAAAATADSGGAIVDQWTRVAVGVDKLNPAFADASRSATGLGQALNQIGPDSNIAEAGLDRAGAAAVRTYGRFGLTANAIHWIISGSMELLAVLVPATVAAGAWAFAWTQGAQNVYGHLTSLYTATESLGQAAGKTFGEFLGLKGVWQQIQNEANPDVYQALGAGINLLKESFGGLAQTGLAVGKIFDTFAAKVVYDFSAAGSAGKTMNSLLANMVPDLTRIGEVFGNIGAALASFASQMPGLAEVLLHLLAIFTGGIKDIIEFTGQFRIFGWSILTVVIALEEFNRWGTLVVGLFGRMGLASTELSGGLSSYFMVGGRFIGILKNMIGVLPQVGFAIAGLASKIPFLGEAIIGTTADVDASRAAFTAWLAELSAVETLGITAVIAGVGYLAYRFVTATSSIQKMGAAMQKAAQDASDMKVLSVIGGNISTLQGKINSLNGSLQHMSGTTGLVNDGLNLLSSQGLGFLDTGLESTVGKFQAFTQSNGTVVNALKTSAQQFGVMPGLIGRVWDSFTGAVTARNDINQLTAAQTKQVSDAANVVQGTQQIASAYHLTSEQALALAQSAGVNLTSALKNSNGQWTVAGEKVRDAVAGYHAMGEATGQVGADLNALSIQTGLAGHEGVAGQPGVGPVHAEPDRRHRRDGGCGAVDRQHRPGGRVGEKQPRRGRVDQPEHEAVRGVAEVLQWRGRAGVDELRPGHGLDHAAAGRLVPHRPDRGRDRRACVLQGHPGHDGADARVRVQEQDGAGHPGRVRAAVGAQYPELPAAEGR